MGTLLCRLFSLKTVLLTLGLTVGLGLPVLSQPILEPSGPTASPTAADLYPAFQAPENIEPPRIRPPAIPEIPIDVQHKLFLSPKFVGMLPGYDGDGFFFQVPSKTDATLGSATEVFKKVVFPFLYDIGFKNPATRFRKFDARYRGSELPQANLETLAKITCRQWWIQNDKQAQQSCRLLSKPSDATSETDAAFKTRTGMTVDQFKKVLERVPVEFFFTQEHEVRAEHLKVPDVPATVPIEHTGIRVEGRKGEAGLFVTGRVIDDDTFVTNVISIRPDAVLPVARKALTKIKGIRSVSEKLLSPVELLLLPYGGTVGPKSQPVFKYAYRTVLVADFLGLNGTFYLWLDADKGEILQLVPTMGSAMATGKTFLRDPNSLPSTGLAEFEIEAIDNPPPNGKFVLSLSRIFKRLDRADALYDDGELEKKAADFIPALTTGELTSPRFDRDPMGTVLLDPTEDPKGVRYLSCADGVNGGANQDFAQVDLMATISRYRSTFNGAGPVLSPFPRTERTIVMDQAGCHPSYGTEGFFFQYCPGYSDPGCPDIGSLNSAHDHTVVAHEFGHAFTKYQYGFPEDLDPAMKPGGDRVDTWCLGPTLEEAPSAPCPKPVLPDDIFHDFADAWSQVLEDTNCFGGWWGKNRGQPEGPNFSLHCKYQGSGPPPPNHQPHHEGGGWPRLSEVGMTFNPADPQDHFPEHRKAGQQGEYSDMQIAAAALWAVRDGLKQRDPAAGAVLYLGRFVQTLGTTGWLGQPTMSPTSSGYIDRDIYRYLVELEIKLASRWAGSLIPGESTINKVASGFARAGIFMIPWACIDVASATPCVDPYVSGADAVIDVDKDVVTRSDNPPTFHIWTGPVYKFDGTDTALSPTMANPAPCNTQYSIEISSAPTFPAGPQTKTRTGSVLNTSTAGCHGTWKPIAAEWNAVKGVSGQTEVYYRVTTRHISAQVPTCPASSASGDVRISTCPASGLFGSFVHPSVLVIPPADTIAPSVPTNLSVTVAGSIQLNISWSASTDNVGVTGYRVFRNGTVIGPVTGLQFQDMSLSPSTTYSYTVQAFDAAGNLSMQSNKVSATTSPQASSGDSEGPSAPTGLQVR
jgi:hypothetical protein